jgi:hypothetical protein
MSRTTRRKNTHSHSWLIVKDEKDITAWELKRFNAKDPKHCRRLMEVEFHSESHSGHWGVPRNFRRFWNRKAKRQAQHEIHRCKTHNEWEDHLPSINVRNAGWYWW